MDIGERHRATAGRESRQAARPSVIVFDTETTGMGPDAEIIEISCVNGLGEVLLDTLVQPRGDIETEAMMVNGIRPSQLEGQPRIEDVMDLLDPVLSSAGFIASYNLEFDHRLLRQSVGPEYDLPHGAKRVCIMERYARHQGEWDERFGSYRWHRLADAMEHCGARPQGTPHSSLQNALGALEVLKHTVRGLRE